MDLTCHLPRIITNPFPENSVSLTSKRRGRRTPMCTEFAVPAEIAENRIVWSRSSPPTMAYTHDEGTLLRCGARQTRSQMRTAGARNRFLLVGLVLEDPVGGKAGLPVGVEPRHVPGICLAPRIPRLRSATTTQFGRWAGGRPVELTIVRTSSPPPLRRT